MNKRFIKFLSIFLLLFLCFITNVNLNYKSVFAGQDITISAKSAYLMDSHTNTIIYSKNENERLPIASMTKIMLLLLAFENEKNGKLNFDENIKISSNASGMGGSQVFLETDGEYKVGDLIKCIVIASANDASVAIAEKMYGTESNAVEQMNKKATELGLKNTLFSNCTGLMQPTQYSSAKDVAIMLKNLCNYDKYFNYSSIYLDEIKHPKDRITGLTNTNKLIKYYSGCDGGKTGFTNEAGFCLACTAKRGNTRLISVVINEPNSNKRFNDTKQLLNYGFDNYCSKTILSTENDLDYKIQVINGKTEWIFIRPKDNYYIFDKINAKNNITVDFEPDNKTFAPIKKGDIVGKLIIFKDNVKIGEVFAVASCDVLKLSYWDYFKKILVI